MRRILLPAAVALMLCACKPEIKTSVVSGNLPQSVGQTVADVTAKVLGDKGGKILVTMDNLGTDNTDTCYGYRKGLELGLARYPHLTLDQIVVQPYPMDGSERDSLGFRLAFYRRMKQEHPEAACIVSFDNAPYLSQADMAQWDAAEMPKLIAVYTPVRGHPFQELFRRGILQAMLVRKTLVIPRSEPQGPYQEVFKQYYSVVMPDNVDEFAQTLQ